MSYKTILVHLDHRPRCAERVNLAFGLAAQFDAHLIGLYAPGAPRIPSYALAEAGPTVREMLDQRRAERASQAEARFRDATRKHGDTSAEWRASDDDADAAVRQSARYADLVVAGQPEAGDEGDLRGLADELAFSAGRPVLFVPYAGRFSAPGKRVLMPDLRAGCPMADFVTGESLRRAKAALPDAAVVTYVNSTAEVKAESDICCTSSNAVEVVESLGVPRVIFLPDEFLGKWVAAQTGVGVVLWKGHCMVHERFTVDEIRRFRAAYDGDIEVLAHPECPPEVLAEADFVGSTSGLIRYVSERHPARVLLVTECSMAANVSVNFPDTEFVRPCNLCPHMNRITLPAIFESLRDLKHEVTVPDDVAARARIAVERMLAVGRGRGG